MVEHDGGQAGCRLLPGATYNVAKPWCESRRFTTELVPSIEPIYTHADCTCNESRALTLRHLVDTGLPHCVDASGLWPELAKVAGNMRSGSSVERCSVQTYLDGYSGNKLRLLQAAQVSLQSRKSGVQDARVRMFLKDDKYTLDGLKEPRCIQYRSKRYHLDLGRYLKPMEEAFYAYRVRDVPVCAKSRNMAQRAADLHELWQTYEQPVALLLDHSKFDAHVGPGLLQLEHDFYQLLNPSPQLARLLRMQRVNSGTTKNGTTYKVSATRMSGDVNTGFGNSVINYALLATWLSSRGVQGSIYVDGDDSVVVVDVKQMHLLNVGWFVQWGMDTKLEVATEFSRVEFCQSRPVYIHEQEQWRMVRNPARVLVRDPWTTKNYPEPALLRLTRTIGWCELACHGGVPVLAAYSKWFMNQGAGRLLRHEVAERLRGVRESSVDTVPGHATRLSFAAAWDLSPAEQVLAERTCDWARVLRVVC